MAALIRPLKEGSVPTYQQKVTLGFTDILASEVDADLDTIYAAWNGGIGTANLGDGAVTTDKLGPDAVTTAKLHDGAVTLPKLDPPLQGPVQGSFPGDLTAAGMVIGRTYGGWKWQSAASPSYGPGWSEISFNEVAYSSGNMAQAGNNWVNSPLLPGNPDCWCIVSCTGNLDANVGGGFSFQLERWNGTSWSILTTVFNAAASGSGLLQASVVYLFNAGISVRAMLGNWTGANRTFTALFPTLTMAFLGKG